ncbi:hypothetical protein WJX84_000492 [Apatococcus fuscideae]|uniref:Uncharacterized protein n=1 Tax=Apatococcus fuscideae TaxID=2026836 RepID=A0AAW1T2T0_9CHLO
MQHLQAAFLCCLIILVSGLHAQHPCTDKDLTSCESDPACSPCRLSAKTFECLEQGTLGSTPCLPLAAPSDCHKVSTAESCQSAGCEWCESAAVGNSCYTEDEAKRLPSAIFSCQSSDAAS